MFRRFVISRSGKAERQKGRAPEVKEWTRYNHLQHSKFVALRERNKAKGLGASVVVQEERWPLAVCIWKARLGDI